ASSKKMSATTIRIGCAAAVIAAIAASVPMPAVRAVSAASPAAVQADAPSTIARAIEALHYFEYEDANAAFREAHRLDASLVMAWWGEAMTYHQTLWRNEDIQQGRAALAQCGPTAAARAAKTRSVKERMYLEAADALFGDGDGDVRRRRYAAAMAAPYAREP